MLARGFTTAPAANGFTNALCGTCPARPGAESNERNTNASSRVMSEHHHHWCAAEYRYARFSHDWVSPADVRSVIEHACLSAAATDRASHSASGVSCGGPENVRQMLNMAYLAPDASRADASASGSARRSSRDADHSARSACAKSPVGAAPAGRAAPPSALTRTSGAFSGAVDVHPVSARSSAPASATYTRTTSIWSWKLRTRVGAGASANP
jgi:hypothetical protein